MLLFSPATANLVLNRNPSNYPMPYLYVCRVAGVLMPGWTVLLLWARRKPVDGPTSF